MRIIKGKPFRLASDYIVPMQSECVDCGKLFRFHVDEVVAVDLWKRDGSVSCYNCYPAVWLDAMVVRMSELKGMPFVMDKVQV